MKYRIKKVGNLHYPQCRFLFIWCAIEVFRKGSVTYHFGYSPWQAKGAISKHRAELLNEKLSKQYNRWWRKLMRAWKRYQVRPEATYDYDV